MSTRFETLSRRSCLKLTALFPLALRSLSQSREYRFQHDHVLGTSLDFTIQTRDVVSAQRAEQAVLERIDHIASIISTRQPGSEINRPGRPPGRSRILSEVLLAYLFWERQTRGAISITPAGFGTAINVDALGKAYIVDRALDAARVASPDAERIIVNIGGDIAVWGDCQIAIADPQSAYDNGDPLTYIRVRNAAVAASGAYARGAHIYDPRTGLPVVTGLGAAVVARDAVAANALATSLCVLGTGEGLSLVEREPGAEALVTTGSGDQYRSSGFARLEQPRVRRVAQKTNWPAGYQMGISLTLTPGRVVNGRASARRPYVAVWIENESSKLVRVLALWAPEPKYFNELSVFYNRAGRNVDFLNTLARATRGPGKYEFVWNGLDDRKMPVSPGTYRVSVEVNQEAGSYAKRSGPIVCGDSPAEIRLAETVNFEPVVVRYGPATSSV